MPRLYSTSLADVAATLIRRTIPQPTPFLSCTITEALAVSGMSMISHTWMTQCKVLLEALHCNPDGCLHKFLD